jgi:PKD repeat protein
MVESFTWDFGDDTTATTSGNTTTHVYRTNGPKTATVTVKTTDGRTATARAEFIVTGI